MEPSVLIGLLILLVPPGTGLAAWLVHAWLRSRRGEPAVHEEPHQANLDGLWFPPKKSDLLLARKIKEYTKS